MKQVAPLRYGVIFKKAFCDVDVFNGFVSDILGIEFHCDKVETEKEFDTIIGSVKPRFDLYAEDKKNRIVVDIQHRRDTDHYDRFLHYHCAALLEQIKLSEDYRPALAVYTIVVLTSGDKHKTPVSVIDFDPKTLQGQALGEIPHKVIYLCPKYLDEKFVPKPYWDWLRIIDDSLDGEVDEYSYSRAEIQKIVHSIEKDGISPAERARMIEEYKEEQAKELALQEGFQLGVEQGRKEAREEERLKAKREMAQQLLQLGVEKAVIMQATGLTEAEFAGFL
jgi:hypothetical protein